MKRMILSRNIIIVEHYNRIEFKLNFMTLTQFDSLYGYIYITEVFLLIC